MMILMIFYTMKMFTGLLSLIYENAQNQVLDILGHLCKNIYSPPQRPFEGQTPPPQSHADEPTSSIEKSVFESYMNDVAIKDINGDGCDGIRTLLDANGTLEMEKKNMPMFNISDRLYCWVEHVKTGVRVKRNSKQ